MNLGALNVIRESVIRAIRVASYVTQHYSLSSYTLTPNGECNGIREHHPEKNNPYYTKGFFKKK